MTSDVDHYRLDGGFSSAELAALKAQLHGVTREHGDCERRLQEDLTEHAGRLRDYAGAVQAYRQHRKQLHAKLKTAKYDMRRADLERQLSLLSSVDDGQTNGEQDPGALAACLYQLDLLKEMISSTEFHGRSDGDEDEEGKWSEGKKGGSVITLMVEGNEFLVKGSLKTFFEEVPKQCIPDYGPVFSAYLRTVPEASLCSAILLCNACQAAVLTVPTQRGTAVRWLRRGQAVVAAHVDSFVRQCDDVASRDFGHQRHLTAKTAQSIHQRLAQLCAFFHGQQGQEEGDAWGLMADREAGGRARSLAWHKLAETAWNIVFAFDSIAGDAVDHLMACLATIVQSRPYSGPDNAADHVIVDHDSVDHDDTVEDDAIIGVVDREVNDGMRISDGMMARLQAMQWVLGMSLMQVMNAYRRQKLADLTHHELMSIVAARFTPSSLRDACLQEIQQDLLDTTSRLEHGDHVGYDADDSDDMGEDDDDCDDHDTGEETTLTPDNSHLSKQGPPGHLNDDSDSADYGEEDDQNELEEELFETPNVSETEG